MVQRLPSLLGRRDRDPKALLDLTLSYIFAQPLRPECSLNAAVFFGEIGFYRSSLHKLIFEFRSLIFSPVHPFTGLQTVQRSLENALCIVQFFLLFLRALFTCADRLDRLRSGVSECSEGFYSFLRGAVLSAYETGCSCA